MKKLLLSICTIFVPFFAWSSTSQNDLEDYANDFAECLRTQNTFEGRKILQIWESEYPENSACIKGLYSVLYLLEGDLFFSIDLMKQAQQELYNKGFPSFLLSMISDLYAQLEEDGFLSTEGRQSPMINLCKGKQPPGVKFKFWIGVAQVAGGCLIMPISPVAGAALIGSGVGCVIDATSTALDNKEQWEMELNQRQQIDPDNLPPKPPNQLPPPQRNSYRSQTHYSDKFNILCLST